LLATEAHTLTNTDGKVSWLVDINSIKRPSNTKDDSHHPFPCRITKNSMMQSKGALRDELPIWNRCQHFGYNADTGSGVNRRMADRRPNSSQLEFRPLPSRIPKVIPPRSVVILASVDKHRTPEWEEDRGTIFRIGYYNERDGLDCIWLVNDEGRYEQTVDRSALIKHFVVLKMSNERDLYGKSKPKMRALKMRQKPASAIPAMMR
jgi:hypothetical protein